MSDEPSLQEVLEVQNHFGLPSPALVEKDFYVVRALAAIVATPKGGLEIAFGGGTALGRAHKLISRMSEDIDLKIFAPDDPPRGALRKLRKAMTASLQRAGFKFDPANRDHCLSGNESRYTIYRLPYAAVSPGEGALRPEIQIEVAVWPLRQPAVTLPVASFVAEAFGRPPEVAGIPCVSIAQTAAEKFVALTRRMAAEIAEAGGPRDPTLARHLYDLHVIRSRYDAAEVARMAKAIIPHDAEVFGNQFPAYRDDPMRETARAIEAMASDATYAQRYATFLRDMVYGEQPTFEEARATVTALAELVRQP